MGEDHTSLGKQPECEYSHLMLDEDTVDYTNVGSNAKNTSSRTDEGAFATSTAAA